MKDWLKYGLLIGLGNWVCYAALLFSNQSNNTYLSVFQQILLGAGIFISLKAKRDEQEGILSFKQGFSVGLKFVSIVGVFVGLYMWYFTTYIDQSFIQFALEQSEKHLKDQGYTGTQLESAIQTTHWVTGPLTIGIATWFSHLFTGGLLVLTMAYVLKSQQKYTPSNEM